MVAAVISLSLLRVHAQAAERAYRKYGQGRCPTNEMLAAREAFEAECEPETVLDLVAAATTLADFANPQHWAVDRSFDPPKAVWIGTYGKSPVEHARAALEPFTAEATDAA